MKKLIFALLMVVPSIAFGAIASGTCTFGTGGTYPNLAAFEADLATTLTGSVTAQCYTTYTDTTPVTFDGTTTASDKRVYIVSTAANRCTLAPTTGTNAISIQDDYVSICGLNVDGGDGVTDHLINIVNANYVTIKNCIVHDGPKTGIRSVNGSNYIFNNIVYNFISDWEQAIGITTGDVVENNTVYNCYRGISLVNTYVATIRNNACFNCEEADFLMVDNCYGYNNVCSDTSGENADFETGSSGNLVSKTFSNNFVSTSNFHLKSDAVDCLDAGATPTYATLDYEGDSIYNSVRDIGADEYTVSGGGTPVAFPQILIFQ